MDLSNDESNFGYGEINETIPVDSHSDIIMIENLEDLKDPLLWETFDKDVGDFPLEDMKKLRFKTLELCGKRSTQRYESMHRTIKTSIDPSMKLYRLVQLYDQVMEELRVQDGHNDYMTVHTYPVIEGVLHSIKHMQQRYIQGIAMNCYARK
ncbi:hypothetical protein Cgig2_019959 [Carnegiea gigantea]|uniref:Uncharacterized protein n=1 Tax=Carnegiea gigantea TaxID=171969 RepID=A0A9Q1GVV9_9CARY|nr:hypothetical protein Cgig2_019959 [Carnegiea gigantea]